jgi:RNA polymerase primary sigma factor
VTTSHCGAHDDLVRLYLAEVGRYPLLTRAEEASLAQAIEAGRQARVQLETTAPRGAEQADLRALVEAGEAATRRFVVSNLRLVVSIAKRYRASGLPLLDLVQEGTLGLMRAVEKFDWRRGFKFSTYATWWIRQAVSRGVANSARTIRLPIHVGDELSMLQQAATRLETVLGRSPTAQELSDEVGLAKRRVREVLKLLPEPVSLSDPLRDGTGGELEDVVEDMTVISPVDAVVSGMLPGAVADLMECLDDREREIVRLRFGFEEGRPRTLEEVGSRFNLTRERVRQIEAAAVGKLRGPAAQADMLELLVT